MRVPIELLNKIYINSSIETRLKINKAIGLSFTELNPLIGMKIIPKLRSTNKIIVMSHIRKNIRDIYGRDY
jgi:hypothetical protein